ncbi:MAG: Radical SAM domain protein [Thermotoga sp. 50_1627]|uniref:TIGR04013 family B12-binding domain/radical SAM domain-containing protein n=1 Tax=Pseudothermotoga sp. TaxID=2033661 RepID=UPI00076D66D6|nr:MAG: Radical SAM domain protein [Thermotoga sp. 50_64]KUK24627.1 MAG: Radical SAM domain protein [Thermotoga sp. 50_1627]MBC7117259.1 TIGR04013 family B12-binding domain/radical SAM domain-containing protein [Pseudothermotoga sp.]HBT39547.1 TIGR04013 family B12-binding domain/radical SAM domain-containing protein [Pseudothermotoga sp.]HCO98384.1 TIGR04013 family B12-binding domain/radical SAM domain-containing protein [Pseudothermotoga sp.]
MRLIFRQTKFNRYSVVALLSAVVSKLDCVEVHIAKKIEDILTQPKDSFVAYSFMSFDLKQVWEEVKILKSKGYTLLAGGPHATARAEDCLKMGFDHVFVGDGEENLIEFLKGERKPIFDGLSKRVDLNDYPPFCVELSQFMPIEISRGCPFNCAYCETSLIAGRVVRHRSVEQIVHYCQLGLKKHKYVARFIAPNAFGYGSKDGVTPNVDCLESLLFNLRKIGMREIYFGTFPSDVRPDSVNDEVVSMIKRYVNNKSVTIGAQSGSDRILRILKRGHSKEDVLIAVEVLLRHGFTPHVDFIFGFPFETQDDQHETMQFIEKLVQLGCRIHAHSFLPLPGTGLEKAGFARLPAWLKKSLSRLASEGKLDGYWQKQEQLSRELISEA